MPVTHLLRAKRKASLSVTASVAGAAVTTETIFSQVVVTAARAGLVTDRKSDEKRGERLLESLDVCFRARRSNENKGRTFVRPLSVIRFITPSLRRSEARRGQLV